ncbi:DUF1000-domain-containing protein, partial [Mycena amicta]
LHCLNESGTHTVASIMSQKQLNSNPSNYLLSDDDPELLLNIPACFHQTVRIRSIIFKAQDRDQAQQPRSIKLFVNRISVGFEDAAADDAAQTFELSPEDLLDGRAIPLRYVRFQSVNSLHIFIASNQGGADETRVDAFDVLGLPVETTKDLSGLKKQDDH